MSLIASRLALVVMALSVSVAAAYADGATPAAPAAAASTGVITLDQAMAVIVQMGFTPIGTPVLKGTVIGSLARLGNNAFIVTVDAMTGKFLDAKPTGQPLPPAMLSASPQPATTTPPPATAITTPPPAATTLTPPSPVMVAANLARAQGFKVLSFKHQADDTFLVGQKNNALFQLKVSDKGVLLSVTPINKRDND